jgi:hypothetical protein
VAKISVLLSFFAFLTSSLAVDAVDPREIVRRSIAVQLENSKRAKNYTFLQRSEERETDDSGKLKSKGSKTWDVTMLEGSSYRRLIERDDHPLPPRDEKKEQEKLHKSIEDRRHETQAQRDKRLNDYNNRPSRNRAMLSEIPDAFDFRLRGEEVVEGRPVYVIEATPRAGYHPKNSEARILLTKVKATAWIDKTDLSWVRIDAEVIDDITWGLCLFRLSQGARLQMKQTRVNDEVWLPRYLHVSGSARMGWVKKNVEHELTFKNFRKFQSDSQILSVTEAR